MVKKVLLFFDDFKQMQDLQKNLLKIGFDCEGVSNLMSLSERLLSFPPDIMLISGNALGTAIQDIADRLKNNRAFRGKVIVLLPSKISNEELLQLRVDALIEENCPFEKLIRVLAHLVDLPATGLIEKYKRASPAATAMSAVNPSMTPDGNGYVTGANSAGGNSTVPAAVATGSIQVAPSSNRLDRFAVGLIPPAGALAFQSSQSFDRKKVLEVVNERLFETQPDVLSERRAYLEKMLKHKG